MREQPARKRFLRVVRRLSMSGKQHIGFINSLGRGLADTLSNHLEKGTGRLEGDGRDDCFSEGGLWQVIQLSR